MGRNGLQKRPNHVTDNYDVEPVTSLKKIKENLPTQHVDEPIYSGSLDMVSEVVIIYHYGGYFEIWPSKEYVSGHLMNTTMDIDFMSYFDMLDDLKKHCKFTVLDGDKFFYLRGDKIMNEYDGLVECCDDLDVKDMLSSYKMHKEKPIEIYTLSKNYDVFENTSLEENNYRDNVPEEVNETIEEHGPTNTTYSKIVKRKTREPTRCLKIIKLKEGEKVCLQFDEDNQAIGDNATQFIWFLGQTVRSRSCCPLKVNCLKEIEQDKIEHMWDIVLEKLDFDVSEERKDPILRHMSDLYIDYRHKMKQKYFDKKTTYQLRLRNKPDRVNLPTSLTQQA
ncbi:hypothetical protein P3S67_007483 [Capsicum chacoense]